MKKDRIHAVCEHFTEGHNTDIGVRRGPEAGFRLLSA